MNQSAATPLAGAAPAPRPKRVARRARWRRRGQGAVIAAVFALSAAPLAMTVLQARPALQQKLHAALQRIPGYPGLAAWYAAANVPVEEMRQLAAPPASWEGPWYAADKNYARFERWFGDRMGMRNAMIRSKNELDYRLFGASSRVYYGKDGELFGRNQLDIELPHVEKVMATAEQRARLVSGLRGYAQSLQRQDVTMLLLAPVAKQYFTRERLPFFAPRLPDQSHFMAFYEALKQVPELHFIDVVAIQRANEGKFPIYFRQDFHWTDVTALEVSAAVTNRIAALEGSALRWRHANAFRYQPFTGVEARFAGRLNAGEEVLEPALVADWPLRHVRTQRDARQTGLEFDTGTLDDPALLPPTCLFGNSFSDSMLRAGLPEHYRQFSKIDRALTLPALPALTAGRCKYLIVQVLDTQAGIWLLR